MLNVHLLNSALSGCCVRSSLIDQQPRASPWPCWLCCIAFLLTKPPPTCHCIIPMLGLLDATGGSHLQLKPTYGGAWHLHCIECWNLSVCPNFGPSLAPYFFSLFCPSALSPWVVPTFISHQNPPLYAPSIPTCSFLCPVAHFVSSCWRWLTVCSLSIWRAAVPSFLPLFCLFTWCIFFFSEVCMLT